MYKICVCVNLKNLKLYWFVENRNIGLKTWILEWTFKKD